MKIKPLEIQQPADLNTTLSTAHLQNFTHQIESNPLISGRLIEGVVLTLAAPVIINHRLGKRPQGWIIVDVQSAGTPIIKRTAWDNLTLTLATSADCTVSIWVF